MNSKLTYQQEYFDRLYRINQGDPWHYEQRWYEQRKRQICLAILPQPSFDSAIEIGCSNGVFAQELAQRSKELVCLDAHATAVEMARQRLRSYGHVNVQQGIIPLDLPKRKFQLIVVSEILYYLDPHSLEQVLQWLHEALDAGGCLLACHWRAPIVDFHFNGDVIHAYLKENLQYRQVLHLEEADFLVDLWVNAAQSVAEQEGLK